MPSGAWAGVRHGLCGDQGQTSERPGDRLGRATTRVDGVTHWQWVFLPASRAAHHRPQPRPGGGRRDPGRASARGVDLRPLRRAAGTGTGTSGLSGPRSQGRTVRHRLRRRRGRAEDPRSSALGHPCRQAKTGTEGQHAGHLRRQGRAPPRCSTRVPAAHPDGPSCSAKSRRGAASSSSFSPIAACRRPITAASRKSARRGLPQGHQRLPVRLGTAIHAAIAPSPERRPPRSIRLDRHPPPRRRILRRRLNAHNSPTP